MALSHISKLFGTKDAKVAKMSADPAGGTATYATALDVPGMKTVRIEGDVETKRLRGDHQLLDQESILQNIKVTFGYAKLSLDVQAAMVGGTVADSGTTPNQIAEWELLGTDPALNYFKFESQVFGVDSVGGTGNLTLWKCKLTAFPPLGSAEEDYNTFEVSAEATPRLADSKWIRVQLLETAVALA